MNHIERYKMMESEQLVIDTLLSLAPKVLNLIKLGIEAEGQDHHEQAAQDIVTKLDHQVGQLIFTTVKVVYPDISLDSEEEAERVKGGDLLIRTDPIDGTKHLAAGIPLFVTSIALKRKEQTIFGMIINPNGGDVYYAIAGQGAYKNGKQIKVSSADLTQSFVFCEQPSSKLFQQNNLLFMDSWIKAGLLQQNAFRTRNIGVGALALCLVASGSAGAFVDLSGTSKLYDMEAGLFIALQAGAIVTDLEGNNLGENLAYDMHSDKKELTTCFIVGNSLASSEITKIFNQ